MQEKKQRGGARPNAGRKKGKRRIQLCVQIDADLIDKIKETGDRNKFINSAVREKLERIETIIKDAEEINTI